MQGKKVGVFACTADPPDKVELTTRELNLRFKARICHISTIRQRVHGAKNLTVEMFTRCYFLCTQSRNPSLHDVFAIIVHVYTCRHLALYLLPFVIEPPIAAAFQVLLHT